MKIFYFLFLLISICSAQMVDTLQYVWLELDDPKTKQVTGIFGEINGHYFSADTFQITAVNDSTWGLRIDSFPEDPFRFNTLISAWVKFFYADPNFIGQPDSACNLFLAGDFNNDNRVNGMDLEQFKKMFGRMGVDYRVFEDMNRDTRVDGRDLQEWKKFNGRSWTPQCN